VRRFRSIARPENDRIIQITLDTDVVGSELAVEVIGRTNSYEYSFVLSLDQAIALRNILTQFTAKKPGRKPGKKLNP